MKITRREFSVGFLSLGLTRASALASSVDFSLSSKRPKIRFGVLADTHFRTSPGNGKVLDKNWGGEYFEKAITYFRQRNVDAVMHCGDFAHLGQVYELQAHADIWNKVFPSSEGAPAKLFVTGNHEFCSHIGGGNGKFVRRLYPNDQKWNDLRKKQKLNRRR